MNLLIKSLSLKQNMSIYKTLYASIGAGLSIAFGGALFALISSIETNSFFHKWLGAAAFSIGLILIVLFKWQLFTGNVLMTFNFLKRNMTFKSVLKNWSLVYLGNFMGSLILVLLLFGLFNEQSFDNSLSLRLISIAEGKISQNSGVLLFKAIACNILVCLAVYLSIVMRKWWSKMIAIVIPITLFVGLGFEHSVANMFLIPIGLIIDDKVTLQSATGLFYNLLWVTIGNIIGGCVVSIIIYFRSEKIGKYE